MAADRLSVVLRAMSEVDVAGPDSIVDRACAAAVALLTLSGAGVSLMVGRELQGTAGGAQPHVVAVQELETTLGEGPSTEAWESGAPVLEPNLARPRMVRWPVFAPAAAQAGIGAVFVLPLRLGAIRIGVLVLCRDAPGVLSGDELAYALVVADVATQVVLGLQAGAPVDALHELLAQEPPHWAEVHQATGMASVQLGVSLDEAFVRLRGRAFAQGRPLRAVAADIVSRRMRLTELE